MTEPSASGGNVTRERGDQVHGVAINCRRREPA